MIRNRVLRVALLTLAAAAGVLLACAALAASPRLLFSLRERALLRELKSRQPADLSFSYRPCGEAAPHQADRLLATEWLEGDVLRCRIVAMVNCADEYAMGDYTVEDGNRLILLYSSVSLWGEAACMCPMEMVYEIRGLEKRDYSIEIRYTRYR